MTGGLARTVMGIVVAHRLGDEAEKYDIPAIVEAIIEQYSFVDLDEIPEGEFAALASRHVIN